MVGTRLGVAPSAPPSRVSCSHRHQVNGMDGNGERRGEKKENVGLLVVAGKHFILPIHVIITTKTETKRRARQEEY